VQGEIYYVRNGRVPIRAPGTNPGRPIAGSYSTNEWQGFHPFADLVQIENPWQAYMHNNNVSPFGMMKDSPLTPEKYARYPYLYNATRTSPRHQRGEMMTELLDAAHDVTAERAIAIAFSPQVYHAERWQERLKAGWQSASASDKTGDAAEVYNLIQQWDRHSDAGSQGALAYYAFKREGLSEANSRAVEPPENLSDAELLAGLRKGAEWLETNFQSVHASYGTLFRVGRKDGDRTYPVGGGSISDAGMATPRAISFNKAGKELVGRSGQTSTQIVIMTDPPESYTVVPLGVSDHKEGGHWDDQAEKLFSKSKATPTYFMNRKELMKHVTTTKTLKATVVAKTSGQAK